MIRSTPQIQVRCAETPGDRAFESKMKPAEDAPRSFKVAAVLLSVMRAAKNAGEVIDGEPRDGHWNREGRRLAAERIYRYLGEQELPVELSAPGNGEDT